MRKLALITLALCLLIALSSSAATGTKKKTTKKKPATPAVKCPKTLKDCPPEGCGGSFDPNLNKQKNILPDDPRTNGDAEAHDVDWMKKLPKKPKGYAKGDPRNVLADLGEGKKIRIYGFLLTIRPEGGETCNCGLTDKDDQVAVNTDNHLVVVNAATVKKYPLPNGANLTQWKAVLAKREPQSITAEFTPRVRLAHRNFTRAKVSPLIHDARQLALPVRLTGMLMFDSEHAFGHHLNRVNDWEVHPILKFEYCPSGETCTADSDSGWKSLDDGTN